MVTLRAELVALICLQAAGCVQSQEVLTRTTNYLTDAGTPPRAPTTDGGASSTGTPFLTDTASPDGPRESSGSRPIRRDAGSLNTPVAAADVVVGTGYYSTCASAFGEVFCWGDNTYGQLGVAPDRALERPARVAVALTAVFIDGGERHMCALDTNGAVYCWGNNDAGQLGQGDQEARYTPSRVKLPKRARALSSGESHVCVIDEQAQLYCWGSNNEGQLALDEDTSNDADKSPYVLAPVHVSDASWATISAGQSHTCGTQTNGSLWCWGSNYSRQVGQYEGERFSAPKRVGQDNDWRLAVAGQTHSCALRDDRSLWCWGSNLEGQAYPLGAEWRGSEDDPQYMSGVEWKQVYTRFMSSCGLTLDNEGLCWGRNKEGQLGVQDFELRNKPTFVGRGGIQISIGLLHTCGVTESLDVYCTGDNQAGQLGVGDFERRNQFTRVRF